MGAKIKDEVWDEIVQYISEGLKPKDAYTIAGISRSAFQKKKKADVRYLHAIKKAREEFKRVHINKIASADQWQSSAWILERMFPEDFKEQKKVEHDGVEIVIKKASES